MAADRGPGRRAGAEADGAEATPRREAPEPDCEAPLEPRSDGAGAGPDPACRLACQSPGPVPCLSNAGLTLPVKHKPRPLQARNPAPLTVCQARQPGNPNPVRLLPFLGLSRVLHTACQDAFPAHFSRTAEPASRLSGPRPGPCAFPHPPYPQPSPLRPASALCGPAPGV